MHWPRITIVNGTTVEDVIVHLAGPKGGRLLITVTDAETNKKIRDAQVSLNHQGNPKTLLISGANRSDYSFNLLIPPHVAVDLKVSAPGYRDWHYKTDSPKGETKTLRVAPRYNERVERFFAATEIAPMWAEVRARTLEPRVWIPATESACQLCVSLSQLATVTIGQFVSTPS